MICPSPKASPCQRKWDSRSIGALVWREPTMKAKPGLVELARVARGQHAGVGDHDQVLELVTLLELADDRQECSGLGLVALEAADLQREAVPVDEQPDDDLGIDPAFLGVADPA